MLTTKLRWYWQQINAETPLWAPGVCSVCHCWIFCSRPGRNQLDIWNAQRLFLFHNDSGQRCPNCPRLPRWDILSTVMRASLRLTVADGEVYIEPWNSAVRCLWQTCLYISQILVCATHARWWMDAQTNTHLTKSPGQTIHVSLHAGRSLKPP